MQKPTVLLSALRADLDAYVVDGVEMPPPDSTPTQFAAMTLLRTFLRKLEPVKGNPAADAAALKKFLAVNERMRAWVIPYEHSIDEELIGEIRDQLYRFWWVDGDTPLVKNLQQVFYQGSVGPGVSLGANGTDFYTKIFSSDLLGTSKALKAWELCVSNEERWYSGQMERAATYKTRCVDVCKLAFVPKYAHISRTIATEPAVNMWFQQGLRSILTQRLKAWGIDLSVQQQVNRDMAREASYVDGDATIDLESASDSISYEICRDMLPPGLFGLLDAFRSSFIQIPHKGRVKLHMMSTMGNAFTFPLQTMIFCAIVRSAYRILGIKWQEPKGVFRYGVNGDDMIVDKRAVSLVYRGLRLLGFTINTDKSYVQGRFRESCGADYLDGVNVRGYYLKHYHSVQHVYAAMNGLLRWSSLHEIPLPRVLHALRLDLRGNVRYVPFDEDDAAGLKIPSALLPTRGGYPASWWGFRKYVAYVAKPEFIQVDFEQRGITVPDGERGRMFNLDGLLLSIAGGFTRGGRILLKAYEGRERYTSKAKVTPRWDYLAPCDDVDPNRGSRLRRLTNAALAEISGFSALKLGREG